MSYRRFAGSAPRIAALLIGGLAALALGPAGPAAADSIYDSRVEQRLDLTAGQRPQVSRIVAESKRRAMAVFETYGIDPNGPPIFDQLVEARSELQAIQRQERKAMEQVLTREQMADYIRIMEETHARVVKAAHEHGRQ